MLLIYFHMVTSVSLSTRQFSLHLLLPLTLHHLPLCLPFNFRSLKHIRNTTR
jgi:hypothetical protein